MTSLIGYCGRHFHILIMFLFHIGFSETKFSFEIVIQPNSKKFSSGTCHNDLRSAAKNVFKNTIVKYLICDCINYIVQIFLGCYPTMWFTGEKEKACVAISRIP